MTSADRNPIQETLSPDAQVTITGRNVEVPEHFQERVNGKLAKIEKLDPTLKSFHVELKHEKNPRREAEAERIQITATNTDKVPNTSPTAASGSKAGSMRASSAPRRLLWSSQRASLPSDRKSVV